jgi:hypothetical protein
MENTFSNLISDNTEENIIVSHNEFKQLYIPLYRRRMDFLNEKTSIIFIKSVEVLIRNHKLYKQYIAVLKNFEASHHCALYKEINDNDKDVKLEMHHGPILTLADYVEIAINYFLDNKPNKITSYKIAEEVLIWHTKNLVQTVFLCEMAHKAAHKKTNGMKGEFIPLDSAFGNIVEFINIYSKYFSERVSNKIINYLSLYNLKKEHLEEFDKKQYILLNNTISTFKTNISIQEDKL